MSKLSQLHDFVKLNIPTPYFKGVSYEEAQDYKKLFQIKNNFKFPVVVRSTYSQEDGEASSFAGHYATVLNVGYNQFEHSVRDVFASYPKPENQQVIIQEMLQPSHSGVLFAFKNGVWKIEFSEGLGENVVSGKKNPFVLLLPKFNKMDKWVASYYNFWKPFEKENPMAFLHGPFLSLSIYTQTLLQYFKHVEAGLDIEFAVENGKMYLLQARPITTKEEKEEVLTSANHKEILPPKPSRAMTSLITSARKDLFAYYQNLDPSLPSRNFIENAQGMPWINLSALLDTMVSWGLPSSLVCKAVGAEDVYKVALRPHIAISKINVFFGLLKEQLLVKKQVERWKAATFAELNRKRADRAALWSQRPEAALNECVEDLKNLYTGLVSHMQQLTGAMSAPVAILHRLGLLQKSKVESKSTEYLKAFNALANGSMDKQEFLELYGFRGFYESDVGQLRFYEYTEQEWNKLLSNKGEIPENLSTQKSKGNFFVKLLTKPVTELIHSREALRHDAMQQFWYFRKELKDGIQKALPNRDIRFEDYHFEDLAELLKNPTDFKKPEYEPQAGWASDTFLHNESGRVLPLNVLVNAGNSLDAKQGIGIYPGVIKGQVWRVAAADFSQLQLPSYEHIILVADSLDPGWIPFFGKVSGVISYVGGILSHASIILRESSIPSITQLPKTIELSEGMWIEMNGQTGEVKKIEA